MENTKTKTIDVEPKWVDLLRVFKKQDKKISNEIIYPELIKLAKTADFIREAQKAEQVAIFYPDGRAIKRDCK